MSHIFISYSHNDAETVLPIIAQLERHFRVWIDKKGIKQGDEWYLTIQQNLQTSVAVLVFISDRSKNQPWVLHEIEEAHKHNIPCHPYSIEQIAEAPSVISEKQYIDGSQSNAFEKLMDQLPQAARIQGHHVIDTRQIGKKVTFSDILDGLPENAYLSRFDGVKWNLSLVGLPLHLTRYCKIYLIGRSNDTLEAIEKVPLCVIMSGREYPNYSMVVDAINHVIIRPDAPLKMLLVVGPPKNNPFDNSDNGYSLDVERPDEWRDAYRAMKKALSFYPNSTPQIFFNGPGALLYPLGSDRRDIAPFELFQLKYGTSDYYRVLWRDLIFGN